jgi:hypothetical protein
MKQGPYFLASEEIPRILRKPKVYKRFQPPPPHLFLTWARLV